MKKKLTINKTLETHGFIEIKRYVKARVMNRDIYGYCEFNNHKHCEICLFKDFETLPRDSKGRIMKEKACICDGYYNVRLRIDRSVVTSNYYCLEHLE